MKQDIAAGRPGFGQLTTAWQIIFRPGHFFANLERDASIWGSLLFLSLLLMLTTSEIALFADAHYIIQALPYTLLFGILLAVGWAHYLSWTVNFFTDAELSRSEAFRIGSYASLPILLLGFAAIFWQLYLNWKGLVLHARISREAATMIMLLPCILIFGLGIGLVMMLAMIGLDVVTPVLERLGV